MPDLTMLAVAAGIDTGGRSRRAALRERIATLVSVLGGQIEPSRPTAALLTALVRQVDPADPSHIWLTAAVLSAQLPNRQTVEQLRRRARLDGLASALPSLTPRYQPGWPVRRGPWPRVDVVTGATLVDLHHTADTHLATGIQRVARQVSQRWARDHDVAVTVWTSRLRSLTILDGEARDRALFGTSHRAAGVPDRVVVPWHCTYLLPELLIEPLRAAALEAMLAFSGSNAGMIGFDCVPISSAETVGEGMAAGFACMLGAAAQLNRISCISLAARGEYLGWKEMLGGAGLSGPDIVAIPLPFEANPANETAATDARDRLASPGLPMVLVVGSHEPRKNHLAVLHAAELVWRSGVAFSLVFVGGNSWRSENFTTQLDYLQSLGRQVESHSGLPDHLLWGAYRAARVVLFPSLNEGYGLPISESLACGTPVITSNYGSMREIAEGGGALTVDPRDDHDIAAALKRLLVDDALHADLSAQARARKGRTWDEYAAATWEFLTAAGPPRAEDSLPSGQVGSA